jgi:uncharacterized protein (DUF1015 family)
MDVSEQTSLLGLAECRPAAELANAADVVQKRSCEQQVVPQAGMELRGLAAERRDADGVLEEAARVAVVALGAGRWERAQCRANVRVPDERADDGREAGMSDLGGEELEEAVQLVGVAPERRRERGRIGVLDGLDGANLHLEPAVEALHATEHAHCVALAKASIEKLDVGPDARLDPSARVSELESEVRRAGARGAPLLPRDGEHAFDRPVLGELGDRRHGSGVYGWGQIGTEFRHLEGQTPGHVHCGHGLQARWPHVGTLAAMAELEPFRAVRYSGAAGPLSDLVAPPYDAVTDEERERLFTLSPYNVVHLTLPESAEEAGRLYRGWLEEGILGQDAEPSEWLLVESYVGPDGVARERRGVVASVAAEPYAVGRVLPHERTHPRIREDRLGLLRATRAQPEPIFLLHEEAFNLAIPEREPDLLADGSRLWRLDGSASPAPLEGPLLIADGHHRFESAIELAAELRPSDPRIMALVVSTSDPGLQVFPTHRVFARRPDLAEAGTGRRFDDVEDALRTLAERPFERSAAVAYRSGGAELVEGTEDELDVELVDRFGLDGISYTPDSALAVAAVDRGEADVAFLLRAPRIADVFAAARRGERMPPKSTYFFPKPLSGLLFHPVEP